MKLLITKSTPSAFWVLKQDKVKQIVFSNYMFHDLSQPRQVQAMPLPWEITLMILEHAFSQNLRDYNFDLCMDMLGISKDFINQIYKKIYEKSDAGVFEKHRRLWLTLNIMEGIHDTYITVLRQRAYSIVKLVRRGDPSLALPIAPWDFNFDIFIESLTGIITEADTNVEVHNVGMTYGDQVWIQGEWKRGVFDCVKFSTPILNLKFVDIFDVLQLNTKRLKSNLNFCRFFNLLKLVYGRHTAINLMIQEGEELSPFISTSNMFCAY